MKTKGRLLAALLSICMVLTCFPFMANATEQTDEVVVVCADADYTPAEGETVFTTISNAVTHLGIGGGTVYIKGDIVLSSLTSPDGIEGTVENRAAVTITGYGGEAANGNVNFSTTNPGVEYLKGDLIFKNVTITGPASEFPIAGIGHKLVLGEGVVIGGGKKHFGSRVSTTKLNDIEIHSGEVETLVSFFRHVTYGTYNTNSLYTLYGGSATYVYTGIRKAGGDATTVNGDSRIDVYGGTFKNVYLGHHSCVNGGTVTGDSIINIYGGNIANTGFGNYADTGHKLGNAVISVWSDGKDGYSLQTETALEVNSNFPAKTDETKKFIAIINNAEKGIASFDETMTGDYVDYILSVKNGNAVPVFERTVADNPATSTFRGFRFTGDGAENYMFPVVNGERLLPEENGLYDLSAYEGSGVLEITMAEYLTPVVTTDESFVPAEGEKVFTTVSSAIDYLGKAGGTIYIYGDISFSNNNGTPLNFEGSVENRKLVTICGYGNSNAAGSLSFNYTNPGSAYIKGDITFENLTIYGTTSEYPFASINHKTTFGEGLSTPSGKLYLGSRNDGGGKHSVDVYSGSFGYAVPIFYNTTWGTKTNTSSEYNIYGGNVTSLYLGVRNASDEVNIWRVNGDSIANIYGGTVTSVNVGHQYHGTILGDSILNIYGGNVSNVSFANTYEKTTQSLGNAVITIWSKGINGSDFTKAISIKQGTLAPAKNADTKKYIAIINNADKGSHSFDSSLSADFCDYMLKVNNGTAQAVFERTNESDPSTSTLKGFRLTAEYQGAEPYVGNVKLTAGDDGLYDLSAYENLGETVIRFAHYGKHWVKYGATGDGSSPEAPAPSVAYLINNVIADTYSEDEEVTVCIMQDDGEELYNSSAYVTDDEGYTASPIGEKPVSHIAPWKSSTDEALSDFAAKLIITSYDDGDTEKNYLIYSDLLGYPDNLHLSGDTVFDSIILVSPKKNHQGIYTNGHNLHFTENCEITGINAYYAENSDIPWDGTFVESQGANAVMNADGSKIIFDHAWTATTSGRRITIGVDGETFDNDATVSIRTPEIVDTPIYISGTTFNKNLNILAAGTDIINVTASSDASVNGAVQYIYNNSSTKINFTDYIRTTVSNLKEIPANGGTWILRADHAAIEKVGMFMDFTETAGTFSCTLEGGVLLAQNLDTLEHTVSKNGLLTIPAGTYDVYYFTPEEGKSYVNTKTYIVALEDTEVDLSTEEHRILEGQIFLGWKNEATGYTPSSTAILSKGDILTAQYDTYDYGYDGEFYIYGVQIRVTEPTGLRFIVDQKSSILEKLGGNEKIIESGSIVLPTDSTHGKDMYYGETIYSNENNSLTTLPHHPLIELGTPVAVPAENIYQQRDDGMLYTVVITEIPQEDYSTFYSVLGYIRYYDANGVEQIVYSDYAQTSLYKIVLRAYADTDSEYTSKHIDMFGSIVDYVEVTEPALYKETYIGDNYEKATKIVCTIDGADCTDPNHSMYKLSNGLNVRDVSIDWDYDASVADETNPVEIAHISDTHFNYNNAKDINENEASIIHQYSTSAFYGEAKSAASAVRAMEYASLMDKVVVTGDIIHSLAYGSLQVSNRLMFDRDTWVGIREQTDENGNPLRKVLGTLGNHERYKHMIGKVPDDNYMTDNYPILQEYFPNDIVYHSEIMTNTNGKNPVMLILLDDQRERYADNIIRDKLAVDLEKARENNVPVLIFQHVGLFSGDASVASHPSYTESSSAPNLGCPGNPNSTDLTKDVYNLITDNADIVRGIFCGHEHLNCYKEIIGTGENGSGHVIPQNYLDTCQDDGGYVIKISVK